MTNRSLKDLYVQQVQDMHSACAQSLAVVRELADAATAQDLREALADGAAGIEQGRDAMAGIARSHGAVPSGEQCRGMEGLVAEARHDVFETDFADDAVRDAAIIAQYQRMAHYAIAGYGTIRAFASRLGLEEDRDAAQECLEKSYDGDRRFTDIATGEVNPAAV